MILEEYIAEGSQLLLMFQKLLLLPVSSLYLLLPDKDVSSKLLPNTKPAYLLPFSLPW